MTQTAAYCQFEEEGDAAICALGLMEDAEHETYEAHLAICAICPEEVAAYLAASLDLPLAYDEIIDTPPSAALRTRILDAAREESERTKPLLLPVAVVGAARRPERQIPPFRRIPTRFLPLTVAAAVLILFLSVGLIVRLGSGGGATPIGTATASTFTLGSAGTANGQATYDPGQRRLSLTLAGMPILGTEQVYQLWLLRDTKLESVQVFRLAGPSGTTSAAVDLPLSTVIYVTIEPAPDGSRLPTTGAIVAGSLARSPGPSGATLPALPCFPASALPCAGTPSPRVVATRESTPTAPATATAEPPTPVPPTVASTAVPQAVPTGIRAATPSSAPVPTVEPTTGALETPTVAPPVGPTAQVPAPAPVPTEPPVPVRPTATTGPPPPPSAPAPSVVPAPTAAPAPVPTAVPTPVPVRRPLPPIAPTAGPAPAPTPVAPPTPTPLPGAPPATAVPSMPPTATPLPGSAPPPPPGTAAPPASAPPTATPVPPTATPVPLLPPLPTATPILPTVPPLPTLPPILPTALPPLPTLPPILPTLPPLLFVPATPVAQGAVEISPGAPR